MKNHGSVERQVEVELVERIGEVGLEWVDGEQVEKDEVEGQWKRKEERKVWEM